MSILITPSSPPPHNETRNQAYTGLLYVGDRPVDLEGLTDRFAGLGTHVVVPEAGDRRVGLEEFANHLDRVQVQIVAAKAAKSRP